MKLTQVLDRTVFACGSALFSDGYVNAASGPVRYILSVQYPDQFKLHNNGKLFTSMVFAGTIIGWWQRSRCTQGLPLTYLAGQASFGYITDRYGRRPGMLFACICELADRVAIRTCATLHSAYVGWRRAVYLLFDLWSCVWSWRLYSRHVHRLDRLPVSFDRDHLFEQETDKAIADSCSVLV